MATTTITLLTLLVFLYASAITCGGLTQKDHYLLSCGASSPTAATDGRSWSPDESDTFAPLNAFSSSTISALANHDPQGPHGPPFSAARIFNSTFTYTFPVSPGPKLLRLYFFPTLYSTYDASRFFLTAKANEHLLLRNFSARLFVDYLPSTFQQQITTDRYVVKEYYIPIPSGQAALMLTFSPDPPNSHAFVNGIEIVTVPDTLYDNLNMGSPSTATALETAYRLNVGGVDEMDGPVPNIYRQWKKDDPYLFLIPGQVAKTNLPIHYTDKVPKYTAPEIVYQTERHLGLIAEKLNLNLTWRFKVDSGFCYMVRMHWCEVDFHFNRTRDRVFHVYINDVNVEDTMDVLDRAGARDVPVFEDYYTANVTGGDQAELWIALHPNLQIATAYNEVLLNGLEIFKINKSEGSLDAPNPGLEIFKINKSEGSLDAPNPPQVSPNEAPQQPKPQKPSHHALAFIVGIAVGSVFLISLLVCLILRCFKAKKDSSITHGTCKGKSSSLSRSKRGRALPSHLCRRFSFEEIRLATQDFHESLIIGHGGFGNVYKGMVDGERGLLAVAIKRLKTSSEQGIREFVTEIEMLSKLRHVHLVSLIGFCDESGEMILVYEYMEHGTLHEHLFGTQNPPLSWTQRLNACIGAAKGLHYLHCGTSEVIIHRDVKSTNILLDEKWVSKISDFGLSKFGPVGKDLSHVSTVVKGSFGYIDLEYCNFQRLTQKSDVYSFGVVLLEVLCGRAVVDLELPKEQVSLVKWAQVHQQRGTLDEIVDPNIKDEVTPACLRKFGELADSCVRENGSDRPSMSDVVWSLEFVLELHEKARTLLNFNTYVPPSSTIVEEYGTTSTSGNYDGDLLSNTSEGMTKTNSSSTLISKSFEHFGESIIGGVFSEIDLNPKGR